MWFIACDPTAIPTVLSTSHNEGTWQAMIFRMRDYIFYPASIYRFRRFLQNAQYWPAEQRKTWIKERLEKVLNHAVENVPYYRKTLAPYRLEFPRMIENLDLSALPLLTKEIIRNHYEELIAENAHQFKPTPTHTSGSTGTPTRFLLDHQSHVSHFASIWRVLNWTGYRFGNKFADMTGFLPRNDALYQYDPRLNCLHLSSFNFKRENMPLYVEKLSKFKPRLIKSYPSAIDLFCRWMRDLKLEGFRPPAVLTCAETLLEHQKKNVVEVLDCPIYDFYNQNERAALISTCEHGNYHVHEEYSFVEVIPDDNSEFSDEPLSQLIATTLHNFAMPLIRYQTNDLAVASQEAACDCGRTYQMIKKIIGRVEDIVVTPDGRHVGRLDAAFKYSPGIRVSQIVQEKIDEIQVKIVKAPHFEQRDVDTVERELRDRLGDSIKITFRVVDSILPEKNGKIKFVVSRPGKELIGIN